MQKLPVEIPEELLRHRHQEFRHNSPQSPNVALTMPLLHAGDLQQSIQQALEGSQEIPYSTTSQLLACLATQTVQQQAMIQSKTPKTATRSARRSNRQARQNIMSMRIEPLLYKQQQEQRPNSTSACTSRMTTTLASSTTTTPQTTTTASQSGRAPARAQGHGMGK